MAEFAVIKDSEAPRPTRHAGRLTARMREYETYIQSVGRGQVGKLVASKEESARGLALRVSRAGKRVNKSVQVWVAEGTVYFKLG